MKSFSMGMDYLRKEALKSKFILESDNDDKLIERLSQVVRRLGPEDALRCDELSKDGKAELQARETASESTEEEKSDESDTDKKPKRKA